jgi:sulfate adenylyltransferase
MLTANERAVTLLDGDIVRTHLSVGLGFDRGGREANLRRIGFVASEIVRHDGVAVCAAVSPYIATRAEVRRMVNGNFVEVFVNTPLETCEQRDTKGMYAKARKGEIDNFTGISDAYEPPDTCEITIETENKTAEENARLIIDYLMDNGFLAQDAEPTMTRERFQ